MPEDQATLTVDRTSPADMQEREPPGHHRLRVHNTLSRRHAEFDAAPGDRIRFSAANVRGKGFELLAMFFGIAPMHTVLERQDET